MTAFPSARVPNAPFSETRLRGAASFSRSPKLKLFADEVTVHSTEGLGSLFETLEVPLLSIAFEPGTDPREEARARTILESFGAVPLECLDDWATLAEAEYAVRCEGSVHDFCAFGAYVVPQLRAMGFLVDVAPDYPFRVVEREPGWYANVEADEERPDWFGLELGIEIDGRRVNLLPALVDMLERSADGGALADLAERPKKCLALPVGEGLYLPVPRERARAILRVLAELYDGVVKPKLEFPLLRAGALVALDEVFKADGVTLECNGDQRARMWARELVTKVDATPPSGLQAELRPYQREGLAWLQRLRASGVSGILADDMGLGKTLQTIAHILLEKQSGRLARPALIVAPTSVAPNWAREIAKFAPSLKVLVLAGAERHAARARIVCSDVVVTTYPVLVRDEEELAKEKFHVVVLDEAQTIKNQRSRTHFAAKALVSEHRLCLSGTPIENHLGELWSLFDFLNPGFLGDELTFNRFYRVPIERGRDEGRLAALRELVGPYILRRDKRSVATELPPKTEVMRPVELRASQRELYESIRVAAHAEVRRLIKKKGLAASTIPILGALTKLRQVCCDPRLVRMDSARGRESAKYDIFFELLEKQLANGHRVLVFSQFTSMLALLQRGIVERRIAHSILTGDTQDRAAAVDKFENDGAKVFLISLKAGGTGITLTSADVVIHYDPWWNPAVQAQATDRAYRIGQTKPVFSYHLFAAGSVEERILALQRSKKNVADAVLGNGSVSSLSEDDVDVLFAPLG